MLVENTIAAVILIVTIGVVGMSWHMLVLMKRERMTAAKGHYLLQVARDLFEYLTEEVEVDKEE